MRGLDADTEVLGKLVGRKSWGHCAASATTKHGAARWERAGYRHCAAGTTDWPRELVGDAAGWKRAGCGQCVTGATDRDRREPYANTGELAKLARR